MRIAMRSKELHGYDGRLIYAGQVFEAREQDVERLRLAGLAELIDAEPTVVTRQRRTYKRRDLKAEA